MSMLEELTVVEREMVAETVLAALLGIGVDLAFAMELYDMGDYGDTVSPAALGVALGQSLTLAAVIADVCRALGIAVPAVVRMALGDEAPARVMRAA